MMLMMRGWRPTRDAADESDGGVAMYLWWAAAVRRRWSRQERCDYVSAMRMAAMRDGVLAMGVHARVMERRAAAER